MFNIETATLQEAVDYSVQQIVKQGAQCLGPRGRCVYGNAEGQHCAIGWLLDTDNPDLMAADCTAGQMLSKTFMKAFPKVLTDHKEVMDYLQDFHDTDQKQYRHSAMESIKDYSIDTSGKWWSEWIDMGTVLPIEKSERFKVAVFTPMEGISSDLYK